MILEIGHLENWRNPCVSRGGDDKHHDRPASHSREATAVETTPQNSAAARPSDIGSAALL